MFRRDLLKSLFGLPLVAGSAFSESDGRSYLFDFTCDPPVTDHPLYEKTLAYGDHQDVYCDGVKMGKVLRFKTGPDGWVEGLMYVDGKYVYDKTGDDITRYRVVGHVRYEDRR